MNSNQKGKRGEREWRDQLREEGFSNARRGQQFSGSPDSPDVVCSDLPQFHFEVKRVERLNIEDAIIQAERDCGGKMAIVAHRRNDSPWRITMSAETFFKLIRENL